MPRKHLFAAVLHWQNWFRLLMAITLVGSPSDFALRAQSRDKSPASSSRVDLRTRLVPGQVLWYQVQLQAATNTTRRGAVSDPQGPSRLTVTWDATIKLEVLGAASASIAANNPLTAPLRVRTTYEHSAASVKGDTPDPESEQVEQSYKRLEGHIIEFTVGPDGHVSEVHGLEGIIDDDKVRQGAEQWIAQVSMPAMAAQGVAVGQTWNSAQPADSMPIAGMIWRSSSTYLRNESCEPAESNQGASSPDICAVILTRQSVLPGRKRRDPTPEDYRRNGLKSSGQWNGSGQSLSYISLRTHLAVSVTQDSSQKIDFTVTNSSGQSIRYAGTIETRSRVELLQSQATESQ
jgi:hypothetical protein